MSTENETYMQTINVVLIGAGGYGAFYRKALFARAKQENVHFAGVVDPTIGGTEIEAELNAAGVPIFADLESFYAAESAHLALIVAPIHYHAPYACTAMQNGSHILCEKPLCATTDEAEQMDKISQETGRFVAVGYQWSYSATIQELKRDILNGDLGKPIRLKTLVLWPRPAAYYARNNWAARIKSDDGRWILDSPINNATAHYLHNMFYVLGDSRETSAQLTRLQAELYRANPIENYDTGALRCWTTDGIEILYYAAHPIHNEIGPHLEFEFEKATVRYQTNGGRTRQGPLVVDFKDGRQKEYGDPFVDADNKIWQAANSVRTGAPLACDLETALTHTIAVGMIQESASPIVNFPQELVRLDGDLTWVDGLGETLLDCYKRGILPAERPTCGWAVAGKEQSTPLASY